MGKSPQPDPPPSGESSERWSSEKKNESRLGSADTTRLSICRWRPPLRNRREVEQTTWEHSRSPRAPGQWSSARRLPEPTGLKRTARPSEPPSPRSRRRTITRAEGTPAPEKRRALSDRGRATKKDCLGLPATTRPAEADLSDPTDAGVTSCGGDPQEQVESLRTTSLKTPAKMTLADWRRTRIRRQWREASPVSSGQEQPWKQWV